MIGHAIGLARMVLDFAYPVPDCGEPDTRPDFVSKLHYTYFGQMLLAITSLAIVIISLLTKPMDKEQVGYQMWEVKCSVKLFLK